MSCHSAFYTREKYLPHGELVMISGDPGIGKGWLALELASAVSTGRALPGQTFEDSEGQLWQVWTVPEGFQGQVS